MQAFSQVLAPRTRNLVSDLKPRVKNDNATPDHAHSTGFQIVEGLAGEPLVKRDHAPDSRLQRGQGETRSPQRSPDPSWSDWRTFAGSYSLSSRYSNDSRRISPIAR